VAAFKTAIRAGLSPLDFWSLTPYLTRLAIMAGRDRQMTDAWIQAKLTRAKKLPELSELLEEQTARKDNMIDLKNHLMGIKR